MQILSVIVVGYQLIDVVRPEKDDVIAYSFRTVTFKKIGATDADYYDLLDIIPKKGDGSDWGTTFGTEFLGGQLMVRTISPDGKFGDLISYNSLFNQGWVKNGSTPIVRNEVPLAPGTALYVQYSKAADCRLSFPKPISEK